MHFIIFHIVMKHLTNIVSITTTYYKITFVKRGNNKYCSNLVFENNIITDNDFKILTCHRNSTK